MFGDNKSVVTSYTVPHSLLSKRYNILSYHRVREAIAAKILVVHWSDSSQNKSDILSNNRILSKDPIGLLVTCVTSYNFVSLYTKNRWVRV